MNPEVFPVRSNLATYVDTWGAPRSGGRSHKGVDIFAERGAPVLAVETGWAVAISGGLTGLGIALTTPDGGTYIYAHLDAYSGRFPRAVSAGDELGTVGDSGNARGGRPHLHFETRPNGKEPVNPVPFLESMRLQSPVPLAVVSTTTKKKTAPKSSKALGTLTSSAGAGLVLLAALYLLSRKAHKKETGAAWL